MCVCVYPGGGGGGQLKGSHSEASVIFASSRGKQEPKACIDFTGQDKDRASGDSQRRTGKNKTRAE